MFNDYFNSLVIPSKYKVSRVSSYDVTGRNMDCWSIEKGHTKILADIDGPGVISHIWMTIRSVDKLYLRKLLLKIYWDGENEPSVCTPVGDFFGLGHAMSYTYQCFPFSTSCNRDGEKGLGVAMNCWLPMPFKNNARIEIENLQNEPVKGLYFYIDYQMHKQLPEDILYLHARWRRENPCKGYSDREYDAVNLDDRDNYLILDAEGRGKYIGVNMSIDNLSNGWWGEGDDMIFIDRDDERKWPPDMHGTGSEDYFCHAWGMQNATHLYTGTSWPQFPKEMIIKGKVCVYRYHIMDPVPFEKSIRVSIEHGHANNRSDDFSSVAYWYQNEPHKVFCSIPVLSELIPNE